MSKKANERRRQADAQKQAMASYRVSKQTKELDRQENVKQLLKKKKDAVGLLLEKTKHLAGGRAVDTTSHEKSMRIIAKKAPRLIVPEYITAINVMLAYNAFRDLDTWEPKGKGRSSLFRSLCEHLFMKYKTPPFLWSGFMHDQADITAPITVALAAGESLQALIKQKKFPVQLTKKMIHDLLTGTNSETSFIKAVRAAQVRALGGDRRLLSAWLETRHGRQFMDLNGEEFWAGCIQWFAQNSMLDPKQIGPLADYISNMRHENPEYSMKGRTAIALLRSMEQWHRDLQRNHVAAWGANSFDKRALYVRSGFKPGKYDFSHMSRDGKPVEDIWFIDEITTGKDLFDEGAAMHHCVASYARNIISGEVSIWKLTHQTNTHADKCLTIEVRNSSKSIVQARGVCNRRADGNELNVLQSWAGQNGLTLNLGLW